MNKGERIRNIFQSGRTDASGGEVRLQKSVLANGLRIISEEIPYLNSFSLGIFVNSGSRDDFHGKPGIAHFIEHLLFRVTPHGTSRQISAKFEEIGAYTNAYTAKEFTNFHLRALSPNFKKSFRLLSDLVLSSTFRKKEFDAEKKVILEEIKLYNDDPDELIFDLGEEMIFGDVPMGMPIAGTLDSINAMTSHDLSDFYSLHYQPTNMIIAVTGNISHEQLVAEAESRFGSMVQSGRDIPRHGFLELPVRRITVDKPVQQSYYLLGRRLPGADSPDKYPVILMNIMLCEGMSSRLQNVVRDKLGLAYSIDSETYFYSDAGTFYISSVVDSENIQQLNKVIFKEMEKAVNKGFFMSELNRAKEQLKANIIMENESLSTRMRSLYRNEIFREADIEETMEIIDSTGLDRVNELTSKYLDHQNWSSITINPEED
jgi:predicted Zn-dependent peptidase